MSFGAYGQSPNIEVELEKRQLAQLVRAGDWKAMQAKIDDMRSRGIDLGKEIIFYEGRGAFELGNFNMADTKFRRYVEVTQGKGPAYVKALDYLAKIQQQKEAAERAERARQAAEAARLAEEKAKKEWLARGMIGTITEINPDWGYVKFTIDQPQKIREPLQVMQAGKLVAVGKLNKVSETTYTATVPGGLDGIPMDGSVYPCCAP